MPHWLPSWQQAGAAALLLALLGRIGLPWLTLRPRVAALVNEIAVVLGLFAIWQLAGALAAGHREGGIARGEAVWRLERTLHLPTETAAQRFILPHPHLVQFFNGYYVYAHFSSLIVLLFWLFLRHPDRYHRARTVIVLTTFACLAIQLFPVAPPRLLSGHGVVDTGIVYGQSVYGPVGTGISDQFSAMPSVHVAWAAAVGLFAWTSTTSKWRWLGMGHALLTGTIVVVTGNHYWLDGGVAVALLGTALAAVHATAGRITSAAAAPVAELLPSPRFRLLGRIWRRLPRNRHAGPAEV